MTPHPKHMTSLFAMHVKICKPYLPAEILIDRARPMNHAVTNILNISQIQYPVNLMPKWDYLALLS